MRNALISILFFQLIIFTNSVKANEETCIDQPYVVVVSDDRETVHQICAAADKAISFLSRVNLFPKRKIYVDIIEEIINNQGYAAYGSYDSRSGRIKLMSYSSIMVSSEKPEMYGEHFDRIHYSGAIAHEITHAVFHHHATAPSPGTAPQEYLAHAAQLAVLPGERRDAIIRKMDVAPWMSGDAISEIYMAFEPGRFAVKSYRHLTEMADPAAFVQVLLNVKWFYVYVP